MPEYMPGGLRRDILVGRAKLLLSQRQHAARLKPRPPEMSQTGPLEIKLVPTLCVGMPYFDAPRRLWPKPTDSVEDANSPRWHKRRAFWERNATRCRNREGHPRQPVDTWQNRLAKVALTQGA
jgi:hypothetical protein